MNNYDLPESHHLVSAQSGHNPGAPTEPEIEPLRMARRQATTAFELKYLEVVLARSQGSIARAAALSKVSRQMLQKLMRKHGVSMPR